VVNNGQVAERKTPEELDSGEETLFVVAGFWLFKHEALQVDVHILIVLHNLLHLLHLLHRGSEIFSENLPCVLLN